MCGLIFLGISDFGFYQGNGQHNWAPTVYAGFKPANFVLIKNVSNGSTFIRSIWVYRAL